MKKMFDRLVLCSLCWWILTGVFGESVSVTEGDSVTLHTDETQIHEDDDVLWKFKSEQTLIAKINRGKQIFTSDGNKARFRDRLKLDSQTGSLTITNTTTEDAGDYKVQISGDKLSTKTFNVSVYARLPTPKISKVDLTSSPPSLQNCSVVCSVVNVHHVTLSWLKGNSVLSSISVSDLSISLSLPLEVEDQDTDNYSCVVKNPIRNQTTHLDISELCHSVTDQSLPLFLIVSISAAAGLLFFVALFVIFCICRKCRKAETPEDRSDSARCKTPQATNTKIETVYENVPKRR